MGPISDADQAIVDALKKVEGVLLKFNPKDLNGSTKNGGVAVICSDGDIDAPFYHAQISHRPHCIRIFGGSLLFAPSFPGFSRRFADDLKRNIKMGMKIKMTKTLFLYFHAPCGVAVAYQCGIRKQIVLAVEAREFFSQDDFFIPEKIHILFHTKRLRGEVVEQNTYKIVA